MDPAGLVALLFTAGILVTAARCIARTPEALGTMFRPPDLGWPSGVQEDDDLHWRWAGRPRVAPAGADRKPPGPGNPWHRPPDRPQPRTRGSR